MLMLYSRARYDYRSNIGKMRGPDMAHKGVDPLLYKCEKEQGKSTSTKFYNVKSYFNGTLQNANPR